MEMIHVKFYQNSIYPIIKAEKFVEAGEIHVSPGENTISIPEKFHTGDSARICGEIARIGGDGVRNLR